MLIKSKYKQVNLSTTQQEVLKNIINKIYTKEYSLVNIPCICGKESNGEIVTNSFAHNFLNTSINVVLCENCGVIRSTPYFSQDAIVDFYTNYYRNIHDNPNSSLEDKFKISLNGSIFTGNSTYAFLKPHIEKYKKNHNKEKLKIFEIGCGYGGNLYNFHQDGEEVFGCDYGEEGLHVAKSKGMQYMFIGGMNILKPYGKPDVVIINHVLEHIVDLKAFFKEFKELISENTLVYIGVPSLNSIALRYKLNIYKYFMIYHVWHFTNNTLDALMGKEGFEKLESNEIIQSVYKYTGEAKEISLLSEYNKNRLMLQIFDNLFRKQQREKIYRKSTVGLIGMLVVLLGLLVFV